MYLLIATRPDISFAFGCASRYLEDLKEVHVGMVKRILKYIRGTKNYGILFRSKVKFSLSCFSDADYAGDVQTRFSRSGFVFMMNSACIAWASQQQKCLALSTMESEYVAA